MKITRTCAVSALTLALACGTAFAAQNAGHHSSASAQLRDAFPGVRLTQDESAVLRVYGKPMSVGVTPDAAVDAWLATYDTVFGAGPLDLAVNHVTEIQYGEKTVYSFKQYLAGLPVEYSHVRLVTLNEDSDGNSRVVYAAGLVAAEPEGGFPALRVDAAEAIAGVRDQAKYADLTQWGTAELVVFFGEIERQPAVRAWKFSGDNGNLAQRERYTFYVDAATGAVVHRRDDILHVDVEGTVTGLATPGTLPDMPSNPPVEMPVLDNRVSISGGNNAYTDLFGDYVIANGGSSNVTVLTDLNFGRWADVNNYGGGGVLSLSQVVTPPGPADFLFNASPSEYFTSQVNGFIVTSKTHNYIKDRAPGFNGLDTRLPVNVNLNDICNAYYDYSSINFFRVGGGCNNTAYSTVISHEYGHHIVNVLGLSQGSFGEGYGDVVGMLIFDTDVVGEYFYQSGGNIREPYNAGVDYPCGGAIHYCGQTLGGTWWGIRLNFGTTYGDQAGLDMTRQLQVDWSLITSGGSGNNSAHPGTAIEVLTADDNDGDIGNGTPNYVDICDAFGQFNIDCPDLELISFNYPDGLPTIVDPNAVYTLRFTVDPIAGQPQPGTGELEYSIDGGAFQQAVVVETSPNQYEATIPGASCESVIEYFVSAEETGGLRFTDPSDAPATTFAAVAAFDEIIYLEDNFQSDLGWQTSGNASSGQWERAVPSGGGDRGDPASDYDGSGMCYVTEDGSGDTDIDGGYVYLDSPTIDLSDGNAKISYALWYTNDFGADPNNDLFKTYVSNNNGSSWTLVEIVGPVSPNGWNVHEFIVGDYVTPTAQVRVRFEASDLNSGSVVEAGIDAFKVSTYDCESDCLGDFDGDGDRDQADLGHLLASYGVDDGGDLDGDGDTDQADLGALLGVYGQDCP